MKKSDALTMVYRICVFLVLILSIYIVTNINLLEIVKATETGPEITYSYSSLDGEILVNGTAVESDGHTVSSVEIRNLNDAEPTWSACNANDDSFDQETEEFNCSVIENGTSTSLELRGTDSALNTNNPPITINLDVDQGPEVYLYETTGLSVSGSVTITGEAYDKDVVASVQYRDTDDETAEGWVECDAVDGVFDQIVEGESGMSEPFICEVTGLDDNTVYNFELKGVDSDGGIKIPESYVIFTVDNPPLVVDNGPEVTMAANGATTTSSSYSITGTATYTNPITGVEFRKYLVSNGAEDGWSGCTLTGGTPEGFSCSAGSLVDGTSYLYEVRASDGTTKTSNSSFGRFSLLRDTSNLIVSWFPMDKSELPGDILGNHPVGTITNDVVASNSGVYGKSLYFDSTKSTYSLLDASSLLDFPGSQDQFNVSFWVKPTSNNSDRWHVLFAKKNAANDGSPWQISLSDNGHIELAVFQLGFNTQTRTDTSDSLVNFGEWNHVIANYDALNRVISIRVNDNPSVRQNLSPFYEYPDYNNPISSGNLIVGDSFEGQLDDIRVSTGVTDYQSPIISFTSLATPSRVTDTTPTISATITDTTGIASVDYYVVGGGDTWVPIGIPQDGAWGGVTETVSITTGALADGTYSIFIRSADIYGNTQVYESDYGEYGYSRPDVLPSYRFVVETVDSTAPDIFVYTIAPNPTINSDVVIKGFVKDYVLLNEGDTASNITDIKYRLNGGEWVTLDNATFDSPMEEFSVSLADLAIGSHTIEFQATDATAHTTDPVIGNAHANVEETFEVIEQPGGLSVTAVSSEIDFRSHLLQDQLASSGVWGNGKLHLKPTLDFGYEAFFAEDVNLFGYDFGKAEVSVSPALDSNYLWVGTDRGDFMYVNKTTKAYTLYPSIHDSRVTAVHDFMAGDDRLLLISYYQAGESILYDTKGTMTVTSDDVYVGYDTKTGFNVNNRGFSVFGVDNSGPTSALFVNLNNGEQAESAENNYIARIDTKNTYDIEDDTITYWGKSDGIREESSNGHNDITANYYDAERNTLILNSYVYGTYVCDLGTSSWDKGDDVCVKTTKDGFDTTAVFSIAEDSNNIYWMGGDNGVWTLDTLDSINPLNHVITERVSIANMSNEHIQKIYWHAGDSPLGDEIIYVTKEGHIRVFNYNSTYSDSIDDVAYDYSLPDALYRTGNGFGFYIEDKDTIWVGSQAIGVSKVEITRSYEDENTVIIIPPLPYGMAAANYFRLQDIVGSVSAGSEFTLSQLTSYEISNDGGTTYLPIAPGDTVYFANAGDQLRLKITMTKGSTPILESIRLTFNSYVTEEEAEIYDPTEMGESTPSTPASNNNNDSNSSGSTSSSGSSVCTEQRPGLLAPYIWKSESLGNGQVKLFFNDASRPITDYHIVFGTKSGKYTYGGIAVAKYGDKSLTVSLLKPNTKYYFKLIPYNGCASGTWSNEVSIRSGGRYSVLTSTIKNTVSEIVKKVTGNTNETIIPEPTTIEVAPEYKANIIPEKPVVQQDNFFVKILKFFGLR